MTREQSTRDAAIWHEVECAGYEADLPLWEELADGVNGPVLELGCGTGRVILHLARRGAAAVGLERDPDLVTRALERAQDSAQIETADARSFSLGTEFALVLAPMQLIQLLDGSRERLECLACVAASLMPGGRAAFAIVEALPSSPPDLPLPPLPDVRQVDGWVYSSLPLEIRRDEGSVVLFRLRQTVSPDGVLRDEENEVRLSLLSARTLEREAVEVGLRPAGRRTVPITDTHVGSTVVLLEKEA